MFLKLAGRPCLVVGAGTVAESKIASLIEADAKVLVVAPDATPGVRSWTQAKQVEWRQRGFQPGDLDGMFVVVAATSSTELHKQIFQESTRRESFAISWMFRSFAIFTIRRWCNAERCKLPFLLPDKARPSRNVCESNLRNSLARNTKRGLRISAKRETSYSPQNWILKNENACSINWRVRRLLKRFAESTNDQVRRDKFGNAADPRLPNTRQHQ